MKLKEPILEDFEDLSDIDSQGGGGSPEPQPQQQAWQPPTQQYQPSASQGIARPTGSRTEHVQEQQSGLQPGSQHQVPAGIPPEVFLQALQMVRSQQPAQHQPQQQMSPEEADRMMKVVRVDQTLVNTLLDPDATPEAKVAALQNYTNQISEHAATLAGMAARMVAEEVHGRYGALLTQQEQMKQERFTEHVVQSVPGLAQHRQLVDLVIQQMKNEGYQTPIPGAAGIPYAQAEIVRRIQMLVPNFQPGAQPQGQQQQFGGMPSLSAPGGGGGAVGSASAQGSKPNWLSALG